MSPQTTKNYQCSPNDETTLNKIKTKNAKTYKKKNLKLKEEKKSKGWQI
jgi:hypothetical protein